MSQGNTFLYKSAIVCVWVYIIKSNQCATSFPKKKYPKIYTKNKHTVIQWAHYVIQKHVICHKIDCKLICLCVVKSAILMFLGHLYLFILILKCSVEIRFGSKNQTEKQQHWVTDLGCSATNRIPWLNYWLLVTH